MADRDERINNEEKRPIGNKKRWVKALVLALIAVTSAVAALFLTVALAVILNTVIIPSVKYEKALDCIETGDYTEAHRLLRSLDGYRDSEEYLSHMRVEYQKEVNLPTGLFSSGDGTATVYPPHFHNGIVNGVYLYGSFSCGICGTLWSEVKADIDPFAGGRCDSEYEYDERGNITKATHSFENGSVCTFDNTYDKNGRLILCSFDMAGQKAVYEFAYDQDGNTVFHSLTSAKKNITIRTEENGEVSYDEKLPDGSGIYARYAPNGSLMTATVISADGAEETFSDKYDEGGRLTVDVDTADLPNRQIFIDEYEYDSHGSVTKKTRKDPTKTVYVYTYEYKYDERGNILSKIESYGEWRAVAYNYEYDSENRLTREWRDRRDGSVWDDAYTYDDGGRVLTKNSSVDGELTYSYTYTYGEDGGLICKKLTRHNVDHRYREETYDKEGRILSETETDINGVVKVSSYAYDENGELVNKTIRKDGRMIYCWAEGQLLLNREDDGKGTYALRGFGGNIILSLMITDSGLEANDFELKVYKDGDVIFELTHSKKTKEACLGFYEYDEHGNKTGSREFTYSYSRGHGQLSRRSSKYRYEGISVTYTP